jgi:flagellar basal-body rod protein FlgG
MFINSLFSALSGMRTSAQKLQTSANNLANIQTPGFKKSRTEISDVESGGAQVSAVTRISTPGSPIPTANPLGLAVNGDGYFQVSLSNGGTGFTRAGSFKIDNTGQITTSAGNPLEPPVSVPGNATGVSIDSSGQVSAIVGGSSVTVGQIELAQFNNPGGLTAQGGNLFSASAASGAPVSGTPGSGSRGTVVSGALESSNVDIAEEVVGQIISKAAFKANASVIRATDELIGSLLDIKS